MRSTREKERFMTNSEENPEFTNIPTEAFKHINICLCAHTHTQSCREYLSLANKF